MCGLAGHIGIADNSRRFYLTLALARGIDTRGGDAAGFLTVNRSGVKRSRVACEWKRAGHKFLQAAAAGSTVCMMHARYATCGIRESSSHAHPFEIERNGKAVLWGAHNGTVPGAWASARRNDRSIEVDSQEIFELIADENYSGIRETRGYGMATWVESRNPNIVKMCMLSDYADICAVAIKGGGVAWASTSHILDRALSFAKLDLDEIVEFEPGRIYEASRDNFAPTSTTDVLLADPWTSTWTSGGRGSALGGWGSEYDDPFEFDDIGSASDRDKAIIVAGDYDYEDEEERYYRKLEEMNDPDSISISEYLDYLRRKGYSE
jgi:hypothetical protein